MTPKAFISYSWTNPSHEAWVIRLAEDLVASGVDVVLDKWNLRDGHDAHAFMEQMVTEPTVTKVVMVCDRAYAEKADGRNGGVGTEAQIITPDLYGKKAQDKFVAVVTENDEHGKPCVPAFYRSRIHIDMSDDAAYPEGFERLLRWAYDKPVHVKPQLGARPAFLDDADRPRLPTEARLRRAADQLRAGNAHGAEAASEFFEAVADGLEAFRIACKGFAEQDFDDRVVRSVADFLPYRDQCVEVCGLLARYSPDDALVRVASRFIEGLLPYLDAPEGTNSWTNCNFDNYRFIVHELFLYLVAALVRQERFDAAGRLLRTGFYVRSGIRKGKVVGYGRILQEVSSLEHRGRRLQSNRSSIQADMLKERCKGVAVRFDELLQADFVLALHARLNEGFWFPVTKPFMTFMGEPFEVFAKASSRAYFERLAPMLGGHALDAFKRAMAGMGGEEASTSRSDFTLSVAEAVALDKICTRP